LQRVQVHAGVLLQESSLPISLDLPRSRRLLGALFVPLAVTLSGCGTSAKNPVTVMAAPSRRVTVNFSDLSVNGASVSTYRESEVNVVAAQADWKAVTTYGNPPSFIQFMASAGSSVAGQIRATAGGANFTFNSVDLYSSTTPIPYTFTELLGSTPVFSVTATQPQTFGSFATVVNPESTAVIDTLLITLDAPTDLGVTDPDRLTSESRRRSSGEERAQRGRGVREMSRTSSRQPDFGAPGRCHEV
jgi:hypothetical protein